MPFSAKLAACHCNPVWIFQCLIIQDGIRQNLHKFCGVHFCFVIMMHELYKVAELQVDTILSNVGIYVGRCRQTYEFWKSYFL